MKNLFDILPSDFFKPLTSKYRRVYSDAILLIFNTFKTEISYGVNREVIVKVLMDYFEGDDDEISFDEETYVSDAREKANGVIAQLKAAGWIEYEQDSDHQLNVVLFDYAVPVIDSMNRIIKEEETEYQGIISQIHASLQNEELYSKPYELIIMGVVENTERLISELKKLNVSIKRHMDKQTSDMDAAEVLDHFFQYHQDIGSKAYLRMKTGDNISYFRSSIIERIDAILESPDIMERAVKGYMEIRHTEDEDIAYDNLVSELMDTKSSFYRLDDIIEEIDNKHRRYMRNAVMRARFLLSTGNNLEGKLSKILNDISEQMNQTSENGTDGQTDDKQVTNLFSIFSQHFLSPESMKTIPVKKKLADIEQIKKAEVLSEKERALYKEALRMKNRNRFSRKNINQYVIALLGDREKLPVTEIPVESKRDFIRIIYISIYAGNRANNYKIKRSGKRAKIGEYELPYFEILKS